MKCVDAAWKAHEAELMRFIAARLPDREEARDLLQEVFLRALRQPDAADEDAQPLAIAPQQQADQQDQRGPQQGFDGQGDQVKLAPPFADLEQLLDRFGEALDVFLTRFFGFFFLAEAPAGDGFAILERRRLQQPGYAVLGGLAGQWLAEQALGLADGDVVTLGNELGAVRLHAEASDGMQESTVIVESQWPGEAFIEGIGINALVSAEPGFPAAGAAYHDTAVWLRRG